jgi:hypothetical protein
VTFDHRKQLEAAAKVFGKSDAYNIELARTKFKLSEVYTGLGMPDESQEALKDANRLRKQFMGANWFASKQEADYDSLVMFWSR